MTDLRDRRTFLRSAAAAAAGWLAVDLVDVEEALAWAAQQTASPGGGALAVLTRDQAAVLDAVTSRILPAVDGRPGAHEAGVVYFIDRALSSFAKPQVQAFADGAADLNRRAARQSPPAASFASLTTAQQDAIVHDIEKTPFFEAARFATIVGTFALPTYGGNRDFAGWRLLGLDHQPRFDAPFGYYDADANRKG